MLPATRMLIERLGAVPEDDPMGFYQEDGAGQMPESVRLELKKRHKMAIIRKMLEDAGYSDLSQMTTVKGL